MAHMCRNVSSYRGTPSAGNDIVFTGIQQMLSPSAWPLSNENRRSIMHLFITERKSQETCGIILYNAGGP
jgi:hypothetical protein